MRQQRKYSICATDWTVHGQNPNRGKNSSFSKHIDQLWGSGSFLFNVLLGSSPEVNWLGYEVNHSLYLMPKLRMRAAVSLLPT